VICGNNAKEFTRAHARPKTCNAQRSTPNAQFKQGCHPGGSG
jgi:hypothetical protein